jgi:excisionase family DNA binding protein
MPLTQADLYEYRNMCAGEYGPQWTAIRKLLDEVRRLTRDLLATKPAGVIRNEEIDSVVRSSLELHRSRISLVSKLRPVAIDSAEPIVDPSVPVAPPQGVSQLALRPDAQRLTLSVGEAAGRLGVSKATLWSLVHRGGIRSILLGRRRLIPVGALDQWIGEAEAVR